MTALSLACFVLANLILVVVHICSKKHRQSQKYKTVVFYFSLVLAIVAFVVMCLVLILIEMRSRNIAGSNMNNVTQLVDGIGDLLELLSASSLHTYCIVLVAVLTALSYLYWWITYSKTSKLLMLQSQNKIDISSDNIDESFIENIISKSAPINKKSRKLMKIFYPIIFGCTFLFAVFGILFAVFMIEGDGYTVPKYELSVKSSSFSSDGVINLTLESDTEKDRTVTIKSNYLLDGEYTELTQDVSFSSSKTQSVTADLNSSNNFASVEYINTFYLDDGHYVDLPNFETRTYYLGGKEFAVINTELFFFNKSSFKCYIRVWH